MSSEKIGVSVKPIKGFLDTVDAVLNSNTFLLQFNFKTDNINADLFSFLNSTSFYEQITNQDKVRGWFNMHFFDLETESYMINSGNILERNFTLTIKEITTQKCDYLEAMLTGDITKGRFRSFYDTQINAAYAKEIVNHFISCLCANNKWKMFFVAPCFLKEINKRYSKKENIRYFNGSDGNDTATVILTNNKGFLLLTNGID